MSEAEEILAAIKAAEELEQRGYTREKCSSCHGTGYHVHGDIHGYPERSPCMGCKGKGYHWRGPLMR